MFGNPTSPKQRFICFVFDWNQREWQQIERDFSIFVSAGCPNCGWQSNHVDWQLNGYVNAMSDETKSNEMLIEMRVKSNAGRKNRRRHIHTHRLSEYKKLQKIEEEKKTPNRKKTQFVRNPVVCCFCWFLSFRFVHFRLIRSTWFVCCHNCSIPFESRRPRRPRVPSI